MTEKLEELLPPTKKEKLFFWLLLSVVSTFFAEVSCANEPFVFWGLVKWLLAVPVYGLHILLLASVFYRSKHKSLTSLYVLGMFFGMYEFLLTKMAWMPTDEPMLRLAEVSVDWTLILVGFWHVLFAFIIPLLFVERFSSSSKDAWSVMPMKIKMKKLSKLLLMLAIFVGFFHGMASKITQELTVQQLFVSSIGNSLFIMVMMVLWDKISGGRRYRMKELLPYGKSRVFVLSLLFIQYIVLFIFVRAEALPERNIGYVMLLLMYSGLWWMYKRSQVVAGKKAEASKAIDAGFDAEYVSFSKHWLSYMVMFVVSSAIAYFSPIALPVMIVVWLLMIAAGATLIVKAVLSLRIKNLVKRDSEN